VGNADSATKTISGAVIMSQVDRSGGSFTLESRLSQYLPSFTGNKSGITVRQAFSHSSGLPGNSLALSNTTISLQQAAVQIAGMPMQYNPGEGFLYGGVSMHAAGSAAEVAAGESWNAMFIQRIAEPLGMTRTRYVLSSESNPRIAGGCDSNAEEFARFMDMLRAGGVYNGVRVLSQSAVSAMFTRQSPQGVPVLGTPIAGLSDYGVGVWLDQRDAQGQLIGALAAGARGFTSWIDFDDGIVGCVATDVSSSGNVRELVALLRSAAEREVRNAPCSPADVGDDTGDPLGPCASFRNNSGINEGDYNAFFNGFFIRASWSDIAFDNGDPLPPFGETPDAGVNNGVNEGDYNCFFNNFFLGCP
jgi:CubicO group peptidase (beta-lactamase class C family)